MFGDTNNNHWHLLSTGILNALIISLSYLISKKALFSPFDSQGNWSVKWLSDLSKIQLYAICIKSPDFYIILYNLLKAIQLIRWESGIAGQFCVVPKPVLSRKATEKVGPVFTSGTKGSLKGRTIFEHRLGYRLDCET